MTSPLSDRVSPHWGGSAAGIKLQPFMIHYTASKHVLIDEVR
jgi:hypothetical protein